MLKARIEGIVARGRIRGRRMRRHVLHAAVDVCRALGAVGDAWRETLIIILNYHWLVAAY